MPNHVHMIVALKTVNNIAANTVGHTANTVGHTANTVGHGSPTLQTVVGRIKSYTAKQTVQLFPSVTTYLLEQKNNDP